uniref:putative nuclease HARBI1 n=1 Tax=Pristiophorus japonicus TaxID=55135 RepID=UPI00398F3EAB
MALPVAFKVTVPLIFFSTGSFQFQARNIANISQFTIHRCIWEVTEALYSRKEERSSRSAQVALPEYQASPVMQGAINCLLMALWALHINPEMFHNCKGYYLLMCSGVRLGPAHHDGECPVYWQQSCQETAPVWCASNLPTIMLGDKDYLLYTWLMTPLRNPTTHGQRSYHDSHAATRNLIEQTIGVLKQRFCCLDRFRRSPPVHAGQVFHFVVVLHAPQLGHHEGAALAITGSGTTSGEGREEAGSRSPFQMGCL